MVRADSPSPVLARTLESPFSLSLPVALRPSRQRLLSKLFQQRRLQRSPRPRLKIVVDDAEYTAKVAEINSLTGAQQQALAAGLQDLAGDLATVVQKDRSVATQIKAAEDSARARYQQANKGGSPTPKAASPTPVKQHSPTVVKQPSPTPVVKQPTVVKQPSPTPIKQPTVVKQPSPTPIKQPTVVKQPSPTPIKQPTPPPAPKGPAYTISAAGFICDDKGRTLYQRASDGTNHVTCDVASGCASFWPNPPVLDGSALPGAIGQCTQDGKTYPTYKGKPMYYFGGDRAAGQTGGDGDGDFATCKP